MAVIDRLYVYSSTQKYGCLLHAGTVLDMKDKKRNPTTKFICSWEESPMNNQVETWYMRCLQESK